jgi:oligopeptide/dipeptide ABC transporter ATP-binding protein
MDRPRRARLDPVQGQPPDLSRLPAGCAFRPRCGFAAERCAVAAPALEAAGGEGHLAACWEAAAVAASSLARAS